MIMLDIQKIRSDFPILNREVNGHSLVYLDNAATTQKPRAVIEAMTRYYEHSNSNIHRGVYILSEEATEQYEDVREKVKKFLNVPQEYEVIFVRGTTEATNLVSHSFGESRIKAGDEILVTQMEHHSNIIPWFLLAKKKGARVVFARMTDDGELDFENFEAKLSSKTNLVSVTHVSNVLGTINPIKNIVRLAHEKNIPVLIDAAQAVPHLPIHLGDIGPDFFAFSAHKMLGPTGIGVLVAKKDWLEVMDPFLGGGEMIREVTEEGATWNDVPWKFEAGTMPIAEVIGFGRAIDYLRDIGMENIHRMETELVGYALEQLNGVDRIRIFGPRDPEKRGGLVSFNLEGVHPHDLASFLDSVGICVRAGHHCAMPLHQRLGVPATIRASLYLYNTREEIDRLVDGMRKAQAMFR